MSFVEKNKTWLLPLLGVGIIAVAYFNFRSASPSPAPPLPAAAPPPQAVQAPPPSQGPATPGKAPDALWNDLLALAPPPESLAQDQALRQRCRENLGAFLEAPAAPRVPRPGWVREAEAPRAPLPEATVHPQAAAPPAPIPPPVVAFILSGPGGQTAWINGRPYRAGETIDGGPYVLVSLDWNRVILKNPRGKTITQVMNKPFHPPAGPRPSTEAP